MLPSTMRRSFLHPRIGASRYALATRQYQTTSRRLYAYKDDQDKDSLNPHSTEYSKSGGDQAAAATENAAFDPSKTSPEEQHESARQETGGDSNNPLNVSPANHDISQPRGAQEGGAQGSAGETGSGSSRQRTSGGGSPKKSGGDKTG
ncbi:hypothetical protein HII31_07344 [Pseudocercospora fuligena]|uniref:Uncharacterized protein n=1 Tax=Pseudocercospora fuligena TaxID=685502 RepID=A0A8H6RHS7_9PEZI|nr:hypothetical protein HII31_07344 [Pseudocercospora fuligena]